MNCNNRSMQLILTFPNLLSTIRIFIAVVLYFTIQREFFYLTLILYLIAVITDILDGIIARKAQKLSNYGIYFDSGADFVLIFGVYLALLNQHQISILFLVFFVFMYLQFIISFMSSKKGYDKMGKYLGTIHILFQIVLLIQILEKFHLLLIIVIYIYSGVCIIKRYKPTSLKKNSDPIPISSTNLLYLSSTQKGVS